MQKPFLFSSVLCDRIEFYIIIIELLRVCVCLENSQQSAQYIVSEKYY